MGVTELRTFVITCDVCNRFGQTVQAIYTAPLPRGWDYEQLHDCGLTGYSTKRVLCDNCLERRRQREAQSVALEGTHEP